MAGFIQLLAALISPTLVTTLPRSHSKLRPTQSMVPLQVSPLLADALQSCVSALYALLQLTASDSELAESGAAARAAAAAADSLLALLQVCCCL